MMMMCAAKAQAELQGIRLLIVEDEQMVALLLEDVLTDLGCDVVGPAFSLADAVRLAGDAAIHGAILDVNLGGEKVYPAADILAARNLPFIFATGYGTGGLREADKSRPVLQKPFNLRRLVDIVKQWR
jgi:CheY-like chemotaxis protein